jgi:hypothetical protein
MVIIKDCSLCFHRFHHFYDIHYETSIKNEGLVQDLMILRFTSTLEHPFFIPAQQMYLSCGFQETKRIPWDGNPDIKKIEYEKKSVNRLMGQGKESG